MKFFSLSTFTRLISGGFNSLFDLPAMPLVVIDKTHETVDELCRYCL